MPRQAVANELHDVVASAVSTDGKDLVGWICQEAMKDAVSAETLLSLLSEEKEKLRNIIIEDCKKSSVPKPPNFWQIKYSPNIARSYSEVIDHQKECAKRISVSYPSSSQVC